MLLLLQLPIVVIAQKLSVRHKVNN